MASLLQALSYTQQYQGISLATTIFAQATVSCRVYAPWRYFKSQLWNVVGSLGTEVQTDKNSRNNNLQADIPTYTNNY